ncbi:MAG: DNA adenine methylase [Kiritimatiellae bacterium]|nr:DNA adenine methylase [Kiritimatiellia bacterium]
MIKYLGSKRTLIPLILEVIRRAAGPARTVLDPFSGTARVGHALKSAGYRMIAGDSNAYAATLARCYVQANREDVEADAGRLVREFNALPGRPGYFTETFCERSRFFQPGNGARVDAIREAIAARALPPDLEAVMLVSLMEAADRVDSTAGVQMAFLKSWSARSYHDLTLRVPDVLPQAAAGPGEAHLLDALECARRFEADVAYLDPPYNQHSYLGNYHIWESLVRWDKPPVYGVACKRNDCRERTSVFNSRPRFARAFRNLLETIRAETLIVSFSNEGFLSRTDMETLLASLWEGQARVVTLAHDYKRYVGAQIGIYNPRGEKVGRVSHLRNTEYLFVVSRKDLSDRFADLTSPRTPRAVRARPPRGSRAAAPRTPEVRGAAGC